MGGSGLLQQQQQQSQQSFPGAGAPLTQAHLLLNQQQQQQGGGGLPPAPSDSLSMQNFHGSMSQLGAPGITVQPPSALGGPPLTVQNPQPARPTLQNLPNQLIQVDLQRGDKKLQIFHIKFDPGKCATTYPASSAATPKKAR